MNPPPCAVEQGSFTLQQKQAKQSPHLRGDEAQKRSKNTCRPKLSVSAPQVEFLKIVHSSHFPWSLLATKTLLYLLSLCTLLTGALFISVACCLAAGLPKSIKQLYPLPACPIQSNLSLATTFLHWPPLNPSPHPCTHLRLDSDLT